MSDTPQKQCTKCKEHLPATSEFFTRDTRNKDELNYRCKKCCHKYYNKLLREGPAKKIILPDGYKHCSKCKKLIPATLEFFHRDMTKPDKFARTCKQCKKRPRKMSIEDGFIVDGMIKCFKCEKVLPATFEYFHADKSKRRNGLATRCKTCVSIHKRKYQSCQVCGTSLISSSAIKYCSPACASHDRKIKEATHTCQVCGASFYPSSNSKGFYCSPQCRAKSQIKTRKVSSCPVCKKDFAQKYHRSTIYCSRECSSIGQRKETTGTCLYCGKEITFKTYNKKVYCSPQCRNTHLNKTLARTRSDWAPDELDYLREHYLTDGSAAVAEALGRQRRQVVEKANKLKITNGRIGQIARLHCDQPSGYELLIRAALDELGVSYESSFVIKDKFIVDIKIGNLIIEADGDYWHGHPRFEPLNERQKKQQRYDAARNKYLQACGYQVERIWESDFSMDYLRNVLHKYNII